MHLRVEPGAPVAVNGAPRPARRSSRIARKAGRRHHRPRPPDHHRTRRPACREPATPRAPANVLRGSQYFPVDPALRVEGRFEPYEAPREVEVPSAQGPPQKTLAPGVVRFTIGGRELTLEPTVESPADKTLFFVFSDATAGTESYGAGRFLYAETPAPGATRVLLDFNLAENPPCAFTPYATCPLPLPKNVLPVKIEAGEKAPAGH
ncbi:MAG: DUF1684 domain-containing protein [Holophagales bacterium]|nr:DUF1684 domain-containing protein [Holophagales bacterium]